MKYYALYLVKGTAVHPILYGAPNKEGRMFWIGGSGAALAAYPNFGSANSARKKSVEIFRHTHPNYEVIIQKVHVLACL